MSETNLKWDAGDLVKAFKAAPQTYVGVMSPALTMMAQEGKKILTKNSPGGKGGEGNLAASWHVQTAGRLKRHIRTPIPYAHFVDQGRKPGKVPPYDPIEQWVHRLGLGERKTGKEREAARPRHVRTPRKEHKPRAPRIARGGKVNAPSREGIIFMIRRSIGEKGTKPTNFLKKSNAELEPIAAKIFDKAVDAFVKAVSTA